MTKKHPLIYLNLRKLKNNLKQMLKTPSHLISIAAILLVLILPTLTSHSSQYSSDMVSQTRDMSEFYAIVYATFAVMASLCFIDVISTGASMFTLSDVNLVFPAPFNSTKVLSYGLFRQLGTAFAVGLFIPFQYSWAHDVYGITVPQLVIVLIGYGLCVFVSQLAGMAVFLYTIESEKRQKAAKIIFFAIILILLLLAAYSLFPFNSISFEFVVSKLSAFANSTTAQIFPVFGWFSAATSAVMSGNIITVLIYLLVSIIFSVIMIVLIFKSKINYYEDAIAAAEKTQSAITAQKEGELGTPVKKNIKVGKVGIGKGEGASVIFHKHMLENKRSRVFALSYTSLFFIAIVIIVAVLARGEGDSDSIFGVFVTAATFALINSNFGRLSGELTRPYVYLMPEPPVKKLYYCIQESLYSGLIESIVMFVPVMFILSASPISTVLCIAGIVSYQLLAISIRLLNQRIFGGFGINMIATILYFVFMIISIIPGILFAVLLTVLLEFSMPLMVTAAIGLIIGNLLVVLLLLFICRNTLQYAELNNK